MHSFHYRRVTHLFDIGGDTKDDDGLEAIGDQGGQELHQQVDTPTKKGDFEKEKKESLEVSKKYICFSHTLKMTALFFSEDTISHVFPFYPIFPHTLNVCECHYLSSLALAPHRQKSPARE
jgi:hypothetical protein